MTNIVLDNSTLKTVNLAQLQDEMLVIRSSVADEVTIEVPDDLNLTSTQIQVLQDVLDDHVALDTGVISVKMATLYGWVDTTNMVAIATDIVARTLLQSVNSSLNTLELCPYFAANLLNYLLGNTIIDQTSHDAIKAGLEELGMVFPT